MLDGVHEAGELHRATHADHPGRQALEALHGAVRLKVLVGYLWQQVSTGAASEAGVSLGGRHARNPTALLYEEVLLEQLDGELGGGVFGGVGLEGKSALLSIPE